VLFSVTIATILSSWYTVKPFGAILFTVVSPFEGSGWTLADLARAIFVSLGLSKGHTADWHRPHSSRMVLGGFANLDHGQIGRPAAFVAAAEDPVSCQHTDIGPRDNARSAVAEGSRNYLGNMLLVLVNCNGRGYREC
jgi:hypothetical protein